MVITNMDNQTKPTLWRLLLVLGISGTSPVVYGMAYGYSSSSGKELTDGGKLDEDQNAWYGSLPILGAVLGSLIAAYTGDAWGRKNTLFSCTVTNLLGWGLVLLALHRNWGNGALIALLYTGRALQGVAGGLQVVVTPVYISECATKETRGGLTCATTLLWQFGILIMYSLGIPLSAKWLALVPFIVILVSGGLLFTLPSSPSFLVKKGEIEKARLALQWLRGNGFNIDQEMNEKEEGCLSTEHRSWVLILTGLKERSFIVPLLISVSLVIVQLASGMTIVIVFSIEVIISAGFKSNPDLISVMTAAILLIFNLFPILLADRVGRCSLLIISCLMSCVCHILLGLYFYLTEVKGHEGLVALSLPAILVYFAFYSIGLSSVVFAVVGEILPLHARGFGFGTAIVCGFTASFLVTQQFPAMKNSSLHAYGTFWFFAVINLLGVFLVAFCIPETKGLSLEEIEDHFKSRHKKSYAVNNSCVASGNQESDL